MCLGLTKFKALSFDIYATLVDWETGIIKQLGTLIQRANEAGKSLPFEVQEGKALLTERAYFLRAYTNYEHEFEAAQARSFGESIENWPAFPDSVAAMLVLAKYYDLIVLSNVNGASFSKTLSGPLSGVVSNFVSSSSQSDLQNLVNPDNRTVDFVFMREQTFSATYTAEQIGSYKADTRNFRDLIEHAKCDIGVEETEILHVAESLAFDHVPAKKIGLAPGVDVDRGSLMGRMLETFEDGEIAQGATFQSLGEFAAEVERAYAK